MLIEPGQVVELRALGVHRNDRPHVEAGFYDAAHLKDMAKAALAVTKCAKGIYFTLNPLNPDLLARRCNRIAWAAEGELSKDKDVLCRRWLLVDADPVRDPLISCGRGCVVSAAALRNAPAAKARSKNGARLGQSATSRSAWPPFADVGPRRVRRGGGGPNPGDAK
jgi:hypothetical protein